MSLLSVIGGFVSAAISIVGPVISTMSDVLINKLPPVIEVAKVAIETISMVISKVCEVLNIAPLDEKAGELGAKVMQDGTRPKLDEESTQEYLDYLRNDVKLDEEKYVKMSDEEKLACEALGISLKAKSIEEKTNVELPPEFLVTIAKSKLKYEQVEKFINAFSENGISSMEQFAKYISNDLSEKDAAKVGNIVKSAIRELSPEMSDEDIQNEIVSMKKDYFFNDN